MAWHSRFAVASGAVGDAIGFYQPWVQEPFDYYYDGDQDQYGMPYSLLGDDKPSTDYAFDPTLYKRLWMMFAHHRTPGSHYDLGSGYLDRHFSQVLHREPQGNIEVVLYELQ